MTHRPSSDFRPWRATACIGIALILLPAMAHAADWNLDQLMRNLAQTRSGRASFVEKKSIAMLDKPIESSGELIFSAPRHLEKRTIKPKPETMIVDNDTLVIERGRQKHTLSLPDYPELSVFIDSILGTLTGDRQALERNYRLSLDGSNENWTLQLLPVDETSTVKRIRIGGTRDAVHRIEIIQVDGDSSLLLIDPRSSP